jgi:hypothetical protein
VADHPVGARPGARMTRHLDDDAGEILHGTVPAGAAMTPAGGKQDGSTRIALSVVLMLVVYSLAHLHATVLGSRMRQPGVAVLARIRADLPHEAAVLEGGLPAQNAPFARAVAMLAWCSAKVSAKHDVPSVWQRTK